MFTAGVGQVMVPTLAPGDIVILDNLGSHEGHRAWRAIRNAGAHLRFLPPCSLDFNPFEQPFAKPKHLMRAAQPRAVRETWREVGALPDTVSPAERADYLANSVYASK